MGWVETTDRQQIPESAVTQKQITSYFCANNSPGREEPRAVNSVEETRSLLHMEETDTVGRPQRVEEGGEESTEKEAEVMVMQEEEEEEENDDHKGQKTELFCATATPLVDQTLQQGFLLSGVSAAVRCGDKVEDNKQYEESVLSNNDCELKNVTTDDNDCGQNT